MLNYDRKLSYQLAFQLCFHRYCLCFVPKQCTNLLWHEYFHPLGMTMSLIWSIWIGHNFFVESGEPNLMHKQLIFKNDSNNNKKE